MGPDYGGGLGGGDPAHGNEGAYQLDRDRSNMTPSPSYPNGVFQAPARPPVREASPALSSTSTNDPRKSNEQNRSRARGRTTSGQLRICHKCGEPLTGQFVRALDGTFHLDCFKCRDCGSIVASKFFPAEDEEGGGQYPLCETDYFRRLGLLCHQCGGALRGSYITALDRKYHVDHFTCSLCSTVFGAQDSYYEHDSNVYCRYHYSTQFAQQCNGCHTAILKQFVEIFRNGQNQHWHPECYMIHKFWNVRLTPAEDHDVPPEELDEAGRELVRTEEEKMEEKVYRIWSVLSAFEESSAACISDMLLHVSNGAFIDGILTAKRFILHVDVLFQAADKLDDSMKQMDSKGLSYGREAKLLCKKIVSFFSLLSKTQEGGVRQLGVTQELLSLVTGLAHYLKLLIRICLQGALKVERERNTQDVLYKFLDDLAVIETTKNDDNSLQISVGMATLSANDSDHCTACRKPIESECALNGDKRWHPACVVCAECGQGLSEDLASAQLQQNLRILCTPCTRHLGGDMSHPFEHISRLQQYIFLLKVALARLLGQLRKSGAIPPANDDPNSSDVRNGHSLSADGGIPMLTAESRSDSFTGVERDRHQRESSYESTLNDVRRLRSTRLDKHLSSSLRKARGSRIMDGPNADNGGYKDREMQIDEDREPGLGGSTDQYFGHQDALTLDDIPRIVAAEQAKEKQPGAYGRNPRQELFRSPATHPASGAGHQRSQSDGRDQELRMNSEPTPRRIGRKFFSELSPIEYFIVRHVAVLTMQPMLDPEFSLDELLSLIEARKPPNFWNKFGKAFGGKDQRKNIKKKGIFGVPLEIIIHRDGADSTDGVGPGALKIPAIIEDTITALKNKDLSVEGVFRKNGNIKRLTEQVAAVDRDGCDAIRWNDESPHQLAALLKRYLRELPDPLMTQKLYRLWIAATKIKDDEKRRHCLHLACCLLPKIERDTLEVLLAFLKWVATFHQVDEDTGSRMDVHNLARVMAPNILCCVHTSPSFSDEPMTAVSCVEELIQFNEDMCMVPDELMDVLSDPSLFSGNGDLSTKDIIKRIGDRSAGGPRQYDTELVNRHDNSRPMATRVDTDPGVWSQERSVRPIQEPYTTNPGTPPQKWRNPAYQDQYDGEKNPEPPENGQRREWRNSGWGPNNSVPAGSD